MRNVLFLFATLALAGCATSPRPIAPLPLSNAAAPAPTSVAERFLTEPRRADELDSLATWTTEDGATWLIATAKSTHQLVVFDADSGQYLRSIGGKGPALGNFQRPNGVVVYGDLVFVSERDNRRIQVLSLPDFRPLGSFGEGQLRSPYGLWLHEPVPGQLQVYVTDSFMYGERHDVVPPLQELSQRIRRYRLEIDDDGRFQAAFVSSFGGTDDATALRVVESIAGDAAHDRLLIADEYTGNGTATRVQEYTLAGRHTGRSLPEGTFAAEPEGIALWSCPEDRGYWIVADQLQPLTIFHLFERHSLRPVGRFSGTAVAWTDGIALHASPTPTFPHGALFAVDEDRAIGAFDLAEIARALQLDPTCMY
ncbi:phytase [Luteimonas sp. RIT-PG2_3]